MKTLLQKSILIAMLAIFGLSNDAKADWQVINNGLTDKNINDMAINGTSVFAATESGIFRSTDAGATWVLLSAPQYAKSMVVKGTDIYAAIQDGTNGIMISSDNGTNWTAVNTGLLYKYNDALAVDGSKIYAHDMGANAYVSSDNGATWTQITSLPGFSTIVRNGSILCAGYSIGGNGYNGIYISSDDGVTWTQPANTGLSDKIQELAVIGSTLFATAVNGMYMSIDNGANWTYHTPVNGNDIDNAITMEVSGTNLFVGTPKGVFLSIDNGTSYTNVSGIIGINSTVAFVTMGTTIFAGTVYNTDGIYKRDITEMAAVTSVVELNEKQNCTIYPNPTSGKFTISINNNFSSIEIYSVVGKKILSLQNVTEVDLSKEAKGIYFVQVNDGTSIYVKKIIVQ